LTSAALQHAGEEGPGEEDGREQVDEYETLGVLGGELAEAARPARTRVVDENVDGAERLGRLGRKALSLLRSGQVGLDRVAAGSGGHGTQAVSVPTREDEASARPAEPVGDGFADPARRSGDEADGAGQLHPPSLSAKRSPPV
jgi:hypothetical protein